jgi:hypothetical protein
VTTLVHVRDGDRTRWAVRREEGDGIVEPALPASPADLLALPLPEARSLVESATDRPPAARHWPAAASTSVPFKPASASCRVDTRVCLHGPRGRAMRRAAVRRPPGRLRLR